MKERLWSDEELIILTKTMNIFRKMRTSATSQNSLFRGGVRLNNLLGGSKVLIEPQVTMEEVQQLGTLFGEFYGSVLANRGNKKGNFSNLQNCLREAEKRYSSFGAATYSGAGLRNSIGDSMIGRFRFLREKPDSFLTWDLTENNHLGATSLDDLIEEDIGIIAPL